MYVYIYFKIWNLRLFFIFSPFLSPTAILFQCFKSISVGTDGSRTVLFGFEV